MITEPTIYHCVESLVNDLQDTMQVWEGVWRGVAISPKLALIPVWCFVHVKLTNKVQVYCSWMVCKIV